MNNLKKLRKQKGMGQVELAKKVGIGQSSYSRYEAGLTDIPIDILLKLADILDTSVDNIIGRDDEQPQIGRPIEEVPEIQPEDEVLIPLVASLRCGPGTSGEPFTCIKPIPVPASYIRRWGEGLQAIIAVGESMSPTIIPGDMLICRPGTDWENGNVVSVNVDDSDMIKRIYRTYDGGIDLRSDNPKFETIHYTEAELRQGHVHILGRVLLPIGKEL